mgnify:CR=1 FL=1
MSLYKKAWLFTLFNILLLVALYFGLPVFDRVLGTLGFLVFGFYILGQGLVAMTVFTCPKCGLSPFMGSQSLFTSGYEAGETMRFQQPEIRRGIVGEIGALLKAKS